MARLIGINSSRRNLLASNKVRVAGAKPRITFPSPVVPFSANQAQPPIFDVNGNYVYNIRDLGVISDDERLLGAINILASSPVATGQTVVPTPTQPPDPTQSPPPASREEECSESREAIQFAAEDSVIWHDNTGRHHIIYGVYITETLPGATYTFRTAGEQQGTNVAQREITVAVQPVQASKAKPVRVLYYNRYDSTNAGRRFDPATAIPFFYVEGVSASDPTGAMLIGHVFTNAFYPEIDHDDRPDTLDLIFWQNTVCQNEPQEQQTITPGPSGPITGDKATSGSGAGGLAQQIGQASGSSGSAISLAASQTQTIVPQGKTSVIQAAQPIPCAEGDPFVGSYPNGKVGVGRTCKRRLMHCEGMHLFVVNQDNALNSLFLMAKPYIVKEFDDGPVSPLVSSDGLVASDKPEGSAENNSTVVTDDGGCPADLDDMFKVQKVATNSIQQQFTQAVNDYQRAIASGDQAAAAAANAIIQSILSGNAQSRTAYQLMLRMLCAPDGRGVPITNGKNIGMLRDIALLKTDWLTLKTQTFFTYTSTPKDCEGGITGPIEFVKMTAPPCNEVAPQFMQGPTYSTVNQTAIGGQPSYSAATVSP